MRPLPTRALPHAARTILCLAILAVRSASSALANDLRIEGRPLERVTGAGGLRVTARVSWKNAWRNARNYDAAWLFVKVRPGPNAPWRHARLAATSRTAAAPFACEPSSDRVGTFCRPSAASFREDISGDVTIDLDPTSIPEQWRSAPSLEARVSGIEMVFIPDGPFSVGDRDTASLSHSAFYRSNASGEHAGPFRITSEAALRVAPEADALYYHAQFSQYEGDRAGPVPAEFPKGTRAFYVMKYEVLQGQYAEFLNMIGHYAASFRSPLGGLDYAHERGSIRIDNGAYVADKPGRPANQMSWDDGTAFADWAGLRPMTELEFTKAARGPVDPVASDYPWGTSSKAGLLRRVAADDDLVASGEADESKLTDATREALGASYFWVMDLAGSVWERAVTIGHPRGRAFRGTHGDGTLRDYGLATNDDWPLGDHEAGGYGYRGGGHYERERERARSATARDLNPHSPVEWRNYGSWGGGPRGVAYGFRAVRTADASR
ncbi:MAG TPA: SUMF1/EgtB/PvdO family nonheme iron enzyme [Gemmatimonadaceae bacterium]|nr:SUMF1/EgtB/PvdO family nonheme iron enzyme [Gemmatimonadaceae bacterium]